MGRFEDLVGAASVLIAAGIAKEYLRKPKAPETPTPPPSPPPPSNLIVTTPPINVPPQSGTLPAAANISGLTPLTTYISAEGVWNYVVGLFSSGWQKQPTPTQRSGPGIAAGGMRGH